MGNLKKANLKNPELSRNLCGLLNNYDSRANKSSVMPLITTETRAVTLSCYVTLKLDIGVAVMEILGGSRDLIHYPLQDAISLAD